jgi:diguanylate cyclase (GGDEF)-like protein/PAS domain S-box-containing protein
MKSPTDTVAIAEFQTVTQLPAPSRLGLLRFERLNEDSWSLLSLDPACEAVLGLSSHSLCATLGTPYSSLIGIEDRERLHQQIQTQLAQGSHYRVQYPLHTPQGTLFIQEQGEALQRHGRPHLQGYLQIIDLPSAPPALVRLEQQNQRLRSSLNTYQKTQADHLQHLRRSRAQQSLIAKLARHRYSSEDAQGEAAQLITQAARETYEVARVSLWRLCDQQLQAVAHYPNPGGLLAPAQTLDLQDAPAYLEALHSGRVIDANNVRRDPRTAQLHKNKLLAADVRSRLDAIVRVDGEVIGVLQLEHSGTPRVWHSDEIAFAGELADHFAQVLSSQQARRANHALHLFQRAVEQSSSAYLLVDREGVVQYVNPSFTQITQYQADEVQGQRLSDLASLADLGELLLDTSSELTQGPSWHREFRSRRKDLEPYWAQLSISKVHDDQGQLTHYIGIYHDISESKQAQQRIERLAFTDGLTSLGNRSSFILSLEQQFARQPQQPFGLLLVDIDNFKRINDSLGHQTGDKLLTSLARRLRNSLVPSSPLARFASNEFAILLDNVEPEKCQDIAQRVLALLDRPLFVDNQLINVTGSLGLACAPSHGRDPQTLLKHAGVALHKAKANGKHQLQVFTEALNAEADNKLFVENNLRRALLQNELEVFYQPKLCLRRGRLLGLEALLRWRHPERGMIFPDEFISSAEESGMIIPIGKWVANEACRMAQQLQAMGLGPMQIAINLSPRQFSDPDLVQSFAAILQEQQLPPHLLELELTESLLLEATGKTHQQLKQLKALGLSLAMDDFGTGYSSLSYLKKFPIDTIKIDRSFVRDIPHNTDDMEITSAVIAMAHKLNLEVVAEGIETPEQLAVLRRQRCNIGQGYLFDKPIAGSELIARLRLYHGRVTH